MNKAVLAAGKTDERYGMTQAEDGIWWLVDNEDSATNVTLGTTDFEEAQSMVDDFNSGRISVGTEVEQRSSTS